MALQETSGYCSFCNKQVLIRRKGTNHLLHLILTILTGGLWIIVWIIAAMCKGKWLCSQCGRPVSKSS